MLLTGETILEILFMVAVVILFSWYSHSLYHHIPGTGSYRREFIRPWPIKLSVAVWLLGGMALAYIRIQLRRAGYSP
jgi:hypothetical protein